MNEFDHPNLDNELLNQEPPASATLNIADDDIGELAQQAKLNKERIKLFRYAVYGALGAFAILIILFVVVIWVYLCMVKSHSKEILSSNFWHIPLMVAIMATSILAITLKLSAHFGKSHTSNDNKNDVSTIPFWQELIDAIKALKSSN